MNVSVDYHITRYVAGHRIGPLTAVARGLLDFASNDLAVGVVALLVLIGVVVGRRIRMALVVVLATIGAFLVADVLKALVRRPRPPLDLAIAHAAGYSMPSTDAAITAAAATALVVVARWSSPRRKGVLALVAALAVLGIGLCLVYLGVHWPSDVLAGWLVGVLVGGALARIGVGILPRPESS